jgi:hypothetical protein
MIRFFTVTAALLNAASVAVRSPISHLKATFAGAPAWSGGAPDCADRRRLTVGDHDGHRVAHVTRGVRRERHVRHNRQILDDARNLLFLPEIPPAGQRVDPGHVLAGEHGHDPRVPARRGGVDLADARVGMRAPDEGGVRHARELQVVDVLAAPGDESRVLASLDRLPEQTASRDGRHDVYLTSSRACARPPTRSPSRCCGNPCTGTGCPRAGGGSAPRTASGSARASGRRS